jgi:apolipoprotein D and lipocalin family protein
MNKPVLALLVLTAAIAAWQLLPTTTFPSNLTKDPPQTVPYVDLDKYIGAWYEQAVIPFYFERQCEKTKAVYSYNPDKSIRVDNSCFRNGVKHESIGKAIPNPKDLEKTNAKLIVEFVSTLDIGGDYWIVRLDKEYTYAVVSSPNYNYLWILYREPNMPETLFQTIYNDLKANDFPVEKLRRTVQ